MKTKLFLISYLFCMFSISCVTNEDQKVFRELGKKKPKVIGALCESSSSLSKEIVSHLEKSNHKNYLEVGAGTGSFSDEIVKNKLNKNNIFDIIEIEPELCKILERKYQNYENVNVFCGSVLDWNPNKKYDAIVSGLPFNAFDKGFVESILTHYEFLASENCCLSFFEYVFIPTYHKLFSSTNHASYAVDQFLTKHKHDSSIVLSNLPPARVYKIKFDS